MTKDSLPMPRQNKQIHFVLGKIYQYKIKLQSISYQILRKIRRKSRITNIFMSCTYDLQVRLKFLLDSLKSTWKVIILSEV